GAIKLLSSIPTVNTLCFGAETADKLAFKSASKYLADEPREVSLKIKQALDEGVSYAKARAQAFAGFIPLDLLLSPNNILGLEYTKAIYRQNASIDILPIERQGAGYSENAIYSNFSSASALRLAIQNGQSLGDNLPKYVLSDLPSKTSNGLELLEKYAILNKKASEIAKVCDCSEGLENAFKRVASENKPLVESLTSTRYTASRIRRIALQNLLNIEEQFIRDCLQAPLYLRVLGVKKGRNDVLSALSESPFSLLVRPRDKEKLQGVAKECFEKDIFAEKVYSLLYPPVSF
ncbi:MAG: nucleotidyltransferase family protein, partial [Clostridiales bacterium]|nr:nucleotidyltransferase family protein [Clostridiales bacterium]